MKQLAIGIDIGGTRTKIGLVDLISGDVLFTSFVPTETRDAAIFMSNFDGTVEEYKCFAAKSGFKIIGIGFGIPGFVSSDGSVNSTYGFLRFMEDYLLKEIVEQRFGLPCRADNDARTVALGEALYGKGKNYSRVLVLTLGTGLGVGFAINGMLNEVLPYAHMAGHITVTNNNEYCYCGKRGCLEDLVSATALCKAAKLLGWETRYPDISLEAKSIFAARANGNPDAILLIEALKGYLKTGIDNYINLYAPEIIVLGGGMSKGLVNDTGDLHTPTLLNPYKAYSTKICVSSLQEHAGILGSAALFIKAIDADIIF